MKVILHMAISVNGMIARENDDTDFLSHDNWVIFVELARQTGAMIWGRKTYEVVRSYGPSFLEDLNPVRKVVVSSDPDFTVEAGWEIAHSPQQALESLEEQQVPEVILVGGARA